MCNLYSITTNQAAIIALFPVVNRYVGNPPPMPGVFPDYPAPVVRNAGAERELTMMRWGNILLGSNRERLAQRPDDLRKARLDPAR
jgi:putative SOS response-associated peptidase YedK